MDSQPHGYRFGDFEVTPEAAELRHSGAMVHLEPRVLKVLVYLIEHRDRMVEKTELLDAVWEETFVTENALTKAIGRLRGALEDDARNPRCIKTVHTLGYRFIAEVEETGTDGAAAPAATPPTGSTAARRRLLPTAVIAVIAGAAIALVLALDQGGLRDRLLGGSAPPEIRSLAVLPLANLTGDPEQEYLVDAMHEALITELAQLSPLRVISRQSTLRYRATDKSMPEIAAELAVDALVEGSVTRSENRVRVSAQIILGPEDEHLWAANFEGRTGDLLALLSDLAGAIGEEIQIAITPGQKALLASRPPVSPEAEDAYFRARYSLSLGTVEGFEEARELFDRATELDPGFAPAHAGLGSAHFLLGRFGRVPYRLAAAESEKAALTALDLAPDLGEAHGLLGAVRLYFDWDWPTAGRELARAIELSPNHSGIRHAYGDYLLVMGRPEEALEQVKLGREYDPGSPIAVAPVVGHLLYLRRYDEVIEQARALLATDPEFPMVWAFLAAALWHRGDRDEALVIWRARMAHDPAVTEALDRGLRESGPPGAMLAVAQLVVKRVEAGRANPITAASFFALGGDLDRAFQFLEKATDDRAPAVLHVTADPAFDILRPDPRFADLLRRIGLPSTQDTLPPRGRRETSDSHKATCSAEPEVLGG